MLCLRHQHCGRLGHRGLALWAAVAFGYFTLMQQLNLLSPALGGWGGPHTFRRQDVVSAQGSRWVTIASSKTLRTRAQAVALFVPAIFGSPYCPVAAWDRALRQFHAAPDAPAFLARPGVHPDHTTTRELISTLREGLRGTGFPHVSRYTLHGLHQGAVQACAAQGVDLSAIMAQGT